MAVFNISNPSNLVPVSYFQMNEWASDVALSRNYLYLVGGSPRFQVFDISNPSNAVPVAGYPADGYPGQECRVVARDSYAYLANGGNGLQIFWVGPPQPIRLTAHRAGNQFQLSWPVSADGFLLESATSLSAPQWQTVSGTPQVEGESYAVTMQASDTSSFFRLWHP
jgi:hypothetical protein